MMKTLYLIRHAKSTRELIDVADIDRPLNERGYRDAKLIGEKLFENSVKPDLLITSPAIRAYTTALIIARKLNCNEDKIQLRKNLYETSAEEYLKQISKADDLTNCIFVFGHNPIISEVVRWLLNKNFEELPTSAVAGLNFNTDKWKDIGTVKAELFVYLFPKLFYPS